MNKYFKQASKILSNIAHYAMAIGTGLRNPPFPIPKHWQNLGNILVWSSNLWTLIFKQRNYDNQMDQSES